MTVVVPALAGDVPPQPPLLRARSRAVSSRREEEEEEEAAGSAADAVDAATATRAVASLSAGMTFDWGGLALLEDNFCSETSNSPSKQ